MQLKRKKGEVGKLINRKKTSISLLKTNELINE